MVSFHRLAEQELNEAAEYYEREQPGLGAAFIADVQRCTDAIVDHPKAGAVIRGLVRRRQCRRFRYGVLYSIRQDSVRILAVMNLRRRPGYWIGRS